MKIIVVGAGIVGTSSALELARNGHEVTLIDQGQVGHGCSFGNAGWMTPCFAFPLPMPGMLLKATKWLMLPSSPLYIKPDPSFLLMNWLIRFLRSMNEEQAQKSIEALVKLSQLSLKKYAALAEDYDFGFQQKGLLMLTQTTDGLAGAIKDSQSVARWDVPSQILNKQQVLELEPHLHGEFHGAVYYPAEAHAEPLKVVQALAQEAQKLGVKILENCQFLSLNHENTQGELRKVASLNTSQGELSADLFVMATGSWSQALSQTLDLNIPILGGKGYSMLTPTTSQHPKIPVMILEKKIAITPHKDVLSIAGTLELVNQDFSITQGRVDAIVKGAQEHLHLTESFPHETPWRGLRPCTPDGIPLLGYHPKSTNMILACGHQMLGLQTGFGTGTLVAELAGNLEPKKTPAKKYWEACYDIFHPGRFS
jgi:D-amino-acid dehydrogenase